MDLIGNYCIPKSVFYFLSLFFKPAIYYCGKIKKIKLQEAEIRQAPWRALITFTQHFLTPDPNVLSHT